MNDSSRRSSGLESGCPVSSLVLCKQIFLFIFQIVVSKFCKCRYDIRKITNGKWHFKTLLRT